MSKQCIICGSECTEDSRDLTDKGTAGLLKFSVQRNDGLREKVKDRAEPLPSPPAAFLSPPPSFLSPPASGTSTPPGFKTPAKLPPKRPATSPAEGTPSRIPVPKLARGRGRAQGRATDELKMAAFEQLCSKLEREDECQFTLSDLVAMTPAAVMYSEKHLERLLIDKYEGRVKVVSRPGKSSILCFLGEKFDQLSEAWYTRGIRNKDEQEERRRIVQKAAEIVRADIRAMVQEPDYFPALDGNGPVLVPESLTLFLHGVTMRRKKAESAAKYKKTCEVLAHSIITATRPRSFISPLLLSLGIWVHRKTGSKTLCDILNLMGSSVSYSCISEYEKSAVIHSKLNVDGEAYIQFVFDNFDFNTDTVDGHSTVHSMGGMVFVTPKTGVPPRGPLPRLTSETRRISLSQFGVIPVESYSRPHIQGFGQISVADMRPSAASLSAAEAGNLMKARQFDLLWLIGNTGVPHVIPGWNGFMSNAMQGTSPYSLTATLPLPFVNLNPSDPTTVFTCLDFAAETASKHGQQFCSVTFDQPLFWKAMDIILSSPQNSPVRKVIVRLGGFHLLMSFMGSIGHLMAGSGLEELWTTVYAKNSVPHMCSGKAYSRAVRAHFLTQTAILSIVLKQVFGAPDIASMRRDLLEQCLAVHRKEVSVPEENEVLLRAREKLDETLHNLEATRTGKLWVQYVRQVELIRLLIRAERVGDWRLHLHAVKEMLPYFHAAGHLNYAKSAHLYLQQMLVAESSLPPAERERLFDQGFFSVRKLNKLWAGNFSDQTIEMDLMKNMKTIGGITTQGRGITESTLAVWIRSMPYCSEVVQALEKFCGLSRGASEQHVELRDATISRDAKHQIVFRDWLEEHSPFDKPCDQLVCLSSGLIADSTVTCDRAYEIGCAAMEKIVGKLFSEITLHRKDKALPIAAMRRSVSIRGNAVQVNPTQLFHRIIVALKDVRELEAHFVYELAPFPLSLFDSDGSMRKTAKAKMVEAVESMFARSDSVIPLEPCYVLDGGFLLRKVVWPRPATYGEVTALYTKHVTQHYGVACTVVFDGYPDGPTTKDQEHNLRAATGTSADLAVITPGMTVLETQNKFLANANNKKLLIKLLSESLQRVGVTVIQAKAEADVPVVLKGIEIAREGKNAVVAGNDTDLLVLLTALADKNLPLHLLIPASGRTGPKVHHIQSIQYKMGNTSRNILENLQTHVDTFLKPGQSHDAVAAAGEKILLAIYGVPAQPNLNKARFHLYRRTIARQSVRANFLLESLPPTSAAARQHSFRTYHQIQMWLENELNPIEWGWKLENNQYIPVTTTNAAAPKELLELISCDCRASCGAGCSCVKAGLKCSGICGHCAGVGCVNAEAERESSDEEDDEEDEEERLDIVTTLKEMGQQSAHHFGQ
ncbi:hypothetical protein FOCC_FOCC000584, partial [Frankliniella occidentalis]